VSSCSRVRGGAPAAITFSAYFRPQNASGSFRLFTVTSEHIRLFTFHFVFFCFYTFLVVGSVR